MKTCKHCDRLMSHIGPGEWLCAKCEYKIKEPVTCENCGKREATQTWVGAGGVMGWVHGMGADWCEICCIEAQIEYAEEAAARIPELKRKRASLVFGEAEKAGGLKHIIAGSDPQEEDIDRLDKRVKIIRSILEAREEGLFEYVEHLTSEVDLEVDDEESGN